MTEKLICDLIKQRMCASSSAPALTGMSTQLIQMQSLRVNVKDEAAAIQALMTANQLSLQMMAAVRALLSGGVVAVA